MTQKREKATTQHSEHAPREDPPQSSAGGAPRYSSVATALVHELHELADDVYGERELLRQVVQHVADGGIIIVHAGSLVFTWPDGGASRRIQAGHWG
jgi:hypothetical protein